MKMVDTKSGGPFRVRVNRTGRRTYSREYKLEVVEQCGVPGASVAAVALSHRINANLVRRWIVRHRNGRLAREPSARLLPVVLSAPSARAEGALYLARIARFSAYATGCGCSKSTSIPPQIVDRYLRARPTTAARWAAQEAIGYAARCFPQRFVAKPSQHDPDRPLLAAYLQHLRVIRGLHPKTCEGLVLTARRIVTWHRQHLSGAPLSVLVAKHVLVMTRDLLSACRSVSARSSTTAYMRSFLRYLHWVNLNARDLAQFVPKTPCWRQAHLASRLPWEDVQRAIDAIETTTPSGMRDRAMMLLLATTGLRNRELRELELGNIRWRAGELPSRSGHASSRRLCA